MKTIFQQILLCLVFCLCFSAQAQQIDSVLSKLNAEYKQEKLYLHFDRAVYLPGETIWFKAYLFTGNYPSLISKTIYAELLDEKGKLLDRKSAPLLMSGAAAAFDLPADITGSAVYIRAYTKWMLNFDSSFIYTRAIPLATLKKSTRVNGPANFSLQFFPEGGDLVHEITSRVAFKATDNKGMPISISGNIVNNVGNKVQSFISAHDGMGYFELIPKTGETYKAVWKDKTGKVNETLLPIAKQNGVVLEVNNNLLQIEFKISRPANKPVPHEFVFVVAQMNNELLYRAKANLVKGATISGILPTENLPPGIVQVTLFTPAEKPIAERITFINQPQVSFITDLNTAVKDAGKRKKNVIQIDVPDTLGTTLSVAVTDADLDPFERNENIFSTLMLTGDIKGYVHNPAYYFSSEEDSVSDHLDLVMMTNGWRRFNWENVLAWRYPKLSYRPDNYLAVEGVVSGLNKTLLAKRELIGVIELKDKKREFINAMVQADGRFAFPEMLFYDTVKLFYQFNNDKNKSLTSRATFDIQTNLLRKALQIKPDSVVLLRLSKQDTVSFAKNIEVYNLQLSDQEFKKVKTLKEVVVTTRQRSKEETMDERYASGLFSGGNSKTFLPEDDPGFASAPNVLEYLRSRVAGLQISTGGNPSVSWRGSTTALFMDEMERELDMIENIPMSDVAMVKVFPPPFFGAFGAGAGGAIAIYLKKGGDSQRSKGLDFTLLPGYSPLKEFYSPDYSKSDQSDIADYRRTIYWNPFVMTDKKNRRIFLSFYNNDITKKFKIIIEGCNEDGKLTRVEKVFQ